MRGCLKPSQRLADLCFHNDDEETLNKLMPDSGRHLSVDYWRMDASGACIRKHVPV